MVDGSEWSSSAFLIDLFGITDPEVKIVFDDTEFSDAFYRYMKWEYYSQEAYEFAAEPIGAKLNGGEVDFEDHLEGYDFHAESNEILAFEQDYRTNMSDSERTLFDSLTRPQQLDYLHSGYIAQTYAAYFYENTPMVQYNGIGDAYRHCLWNALSTTKLGANLTQQLTDAHEEKPFDYALQYKEKAMDLFNNDIGRGIGNEGNFMIMSIVKMALENGDLRYLSNTTPRATSNSQLIPTNQ